MLRRYFSSSSSPLSCLTPQRRRVVVTGIGAISGHGRGTESLFSALRTGRSAIKISHQGDGTSNYLTDPVGTKNQWRLMSPVPISDIPYSTATLQLLLSRFFNAKERDALGTNDMLAALAIHDALCDSNWFPSDPYHQHRTGCVVSSAFGNLASAHHAARSLASGDKLEHALPKHILAMLGVPPLHMSLKHGFCGPTFGLQAACAGGAISLSTAAGIIRYGAADVMIAGGSDTIDPLVIGGFMRAGAMSTEKENGAAACRPLDEQRTGTVCGSGAAMLILEELSHAQARGAHIYAELDAEATHREGSSMVSPSREGEYQTMRTALIAAQRTAEDIDLFIPHLTATIKGDKVEMDAIAGLFKSCNRKPYITATKGSIGHTGGAAAAFDAIAACMALSRGELFPIVGLSTPFPEALACGNLVRDAINLPTAAGAKTGLSTAMIHSLGLGGEESCLVFSTNRLTEEPAPAASAHNAGASAAAKERLSLSDVNDALIGTWRLISVHREQKADGKIVPEPMGQAPTGILSYNVDGCMSALLTWESRGQFHSLSYAGKYDLNSAGEVVHHVEISSNPTWRGQDQVRCFHLQSSIVETTLEIHTPPLVAPGIDFEDANPHRLVLKWTKTRTRAA